MLPSLTLPNNRTTSALGFGCASLLRLPDARQRQELLGLSVDLGIRHFDVARMYGLGSAEAELAGLIRRHPDQLTISTKFGLGSLRVPSVAIQRQGTIRRLLQLMPGLRSLARQMAGTRTIPRDYSDVHCAQSLRISLQQLGLETVDFLLLHEPRLNDVINPSLADCLLELHRTGLIGGYGISGLRDDTFQLYRQYPQLAPHLLQWEDDGLCLNPFEPFVPHPSLPLHGRFGLIRRSFKSIQRAFSAVPQLQVFWSERLDEDLSEPDVLVAALLSACLASHPNDMLLYATTNPLRLKRVLKLVHNASWQACELVAFRRFWRTSPMSNDV